MSSPEQKPPPASNEKKAETITPLEDLKRTLGSMLGQFKAALPGHVKPEKFLRVIQTAVSTNGNLVTAERSTLFSACMQAAQQGLLPDGKEAAIVTFRTKIKVGTVEKWIEKAQFMPMIQGILKKIRNSGELSMITSNVVYERDSFDYFVDSEGEHMKHRPNIFEERGERLGVYALAKTKDGAVYIEVLSKDQVGAIRNSSRSKDSGPWAGDFQDEMWRKSALRRLSKRLPSSTDIEETINADDDLFLPDTEPPEPRRAQLVIDVAKKSNLQKIIDERNATTSDPSGSEPGTEREKVTVDVVKNEEIPI